MPNSCEAAWTVLKRFSFQFPTDLFFSGAGDVTFHTFLNTAELSDLVCVLPMVLVCSRGSAVRTGSVALEGRPAPALLTARTLNWYSVPSFRPNTG